MSDNKHRVTVDRNICIGCSCCSNTCSNFTVKQVGDHFKSFPNEEHVYEDIDSHLEAEEGCPVNCIKVEKL